MGFVFLLKGTPEQFKLLLINKPCQMPAYQPATLHVGYGFNIENKKHSYGNNDAHTSNRQLPKRTAVSRQM
jgi:hypothetical protein